MDITIIKQQWKTVLKELRQSVNTYTTIEDIDKAYSELVRYEIEQIEDIGIYNSLMYNTIKEHDFVSHMYARDNICSNHIAMREIAELRTILYAVMICIVSKGR